MTETNKATLRKLALNMLTREAGSDADSKAFATATHRAYNDLARVLVPVIGDVGVTALTARAWHLAQRAYPPLAREGDSTAAGEPFPQLRWSLEQQDDPAVAAEGAAVTFSIFLMLLVTFIGEPLTMNLLRRAWPDRFDPSTEETRP